MPFRQLAENRRTWADGVYGPDLFSPDIRDAFSRTFPPAAHPSQVGRSELSQPEEHNSEEKDAPSSRIDEGDDWDGQEWNDWYAWYGKPREPKSPTVRDAATKDSSPPTIAPPTEEIDSQHTMSSAGSPHLMSSIVFGKVDASKSTIEGGGDPESLRRRSRKCRSLISPMRKRQLS